MVTLSYNQTQPLHDHQCNSLLWSPLDSLISSHNVRNLGVQFDETMSMTMESHITTVCKSAIYHLRNIAIIRRYLVPSATEQIVHAFVTSRLDVGNAFLYRLPFKQIQRLQTVQNWAARLVVGATKFCRATPLLRELHWLPIAVRVEFKIGESCRDLSSSSIGPVLYIQYYCTPWHHLSIMSFISGISDDTVSFDEIAVLFK